MGALFLCDERLFAIPERLREFAEGKFRRASGGIAWQYAEGILLVALPSSPRVATATAAGGRLREQESSCRNTKNTEQVSLRRIF